MSMIYTVTLNPAIDYVVHTACMRLGEVNRSTHESMYIGGKGINVSAVLRELHVSSTALGFTAGFTGEAIIRGVHDMGINADFVHLEKGISRINLKIKSGEETELNGCGPVIPDETIAALFEKLTLLKDGDTIVLAGSIPGSLPADIYERILQKLSGNAIRTVVDASGELLRRVLPYHPFLIKPNHHELGELFGVELHDMEAALPYAKKLQEMGARNVLVSMAEQGAFVLCEEGTVHCCGVCKGIVKNSVGAGDSMLAGFLAGLEEGDAAHALCLGTAAGGATAFSEGLAKEAEIRRLLAEIKS